MEILKPHSLTQFVEIAAPFLCRAEAAHGLLRGTAIASVSSKPDAYSAVVMSKAAVVAAGLRTTTRLIVSDEGEAGAMSLLASDATGPELQGVIGPRESVETFAAASGGEWRRFMARGARRVVHEPMAPGAMRAALTRSVLDSGRQFVFLHTDLSNPTSNALYIRLGYQHVSNVDVLQRIL